MGDGCEAYSSNLFIPAKSELPSKDNTAVRHIYFQQFNEDYQNMTRYSLIDTLSFRTNQTFPERNRKLT